MSRAARRLCLVLGWLALLTGCQPAPPPDRIRFGLPTAPVTLDPRYATDAVSARLVRLLHTALIDFDATSRPRPGLAVCAAQAALRVRCELRATARFTNGRAVTARDVAATYRAVLDPKLASPHRDGLRGIAEVAVINPRTVEFLLQAPDAQFIAKLTLGVLAAADAGRPRDAWQVGCGPFEILEQTLAGRVLLRRRADGVLVEFHPVLDSAVRALKLVGGELDIVQGNLPPELFDWLAARPGLNGVRVPGATFSYLGFNLAHGPAAERAVRAAVAHAIDRAAIVRHVFRGQARVANALFPPEHWAGPRTLAGPAHDPALARRLLAGAGYGGRRLVLTYKTSSDYFRVRLATLLQAQLAEVGIDLDVRSLDWGTFYADVKAGRFALYGLSWVGLRVPDIYRHAFHSSAMPPAGANRGRYLEPAVDRLIEEAEAAPDASAQAVAYQALAARLLYDLPYVPLWFEDQTYVVRDDIAGYGTDQDGNFDALGVVHRVKRDARP